ncbi:hypothetical protein [Niveibacterium sp. SC-1]|uniref:hypothetical protein n=1 Tax=Niveibacterium sp. SC-1 TaxID=3135646 RepID=UPI00311ED368
MYHMAGAGAHAAPVIDRAQASAPNPRHAEFEPPGPWARWQENTQGLCVETDRLGMHPVFHARLKSGMAVAESAAELLARGADASTDDDAIALFLRLGFFVEQDTPFLHIRAFPPGGRFRWSERDGWRAEGRIALPAVDESLSLDAAIDGFITLFREAIKPALVVAPADTALPLSGGRDSRHIALELHRQGFAPSLVCVQRFGPGAPDGDAPIAVALGQRLGWQVREVPPATRPCADELDKNRRFDCLADEHAWFAPCARFLARHQPRWIFDGLAGGALATGTFLRAHWQAAWQAGDPRQLLRAINGDRYGAEEWVLERLLGRRALARWSEDRALARFEAAIAPYREDPRGLERFMFWSRTRREIAPFILRYGAPARVITPYLAPGLFEFLWALPSRVLRSAQGSLHDLALHRAYPELADLPFAGGPPPRDPGAHASAMARGLLASAELWRSGSVPDWIWLLPRLLAAAASKPLAVQMSPYLGWLAWFASLQAMTRGRS